MDFATRSAIISPDLSILSFLIQHMGKVLVFGALEARANPPRGAGWVRVVYVVFVVGSGFAYSCVC